MSEISKEMDCESKSVYLKEFDVSVRCEKRQREENLRSSSGASIDEEGFTLVTRRKPKCQVVRKLSSSDYNDDIEMMKETQENEKIEVSITSKEILPKQMALAKLLRAENIQSILNVKYKGPYKVLIEFDDNENAQKLLSNTKFAELDYRCQLTQGLQMIFGVVRNIDLDIQEEEMMESFESEYEILSIKRLKRFLENGDWVESESVRVCFKSSTLPSYIIIYGCRFKVDPFTFPVTQCSSCWRYGHSKKFCPIKKLFCPKCGNQHSNCETKIYTCINCKGDHMALDRPACPVFHKEKEIRNIMCEESCKYKKALFIYYNKRKICDRLQRNRLNEVNIETNSCGINNYEKNLNKTYRDILVAQVNINNENKETSSNTENEEEENVEIAHSGSRKIKKRRKKKDNNVEIECVTEDKKREQHQGENKESKGKRKRFDFARLLLKIKEVFISQTSFENKMKSIFEVILSEIKVLVVELIKSSNIITNFFNILYND